MHSDLSKTSSTEIDSRSTAELQPLWVRALTIAAVAQIVLTPALLWLSGDGRFSWQMYSRPIQYRIKYVARKSGMQDQSPAPEVLLEQFRHLTAGHLHQYNYSAKALQCELQSFLNQRASQLETPFRAVLSYRDIGSEAWVRVEIESKPLAQSRPLKAGRKND
jgi:hypothetical protein